jgi:hypothetical protein
MVIAAVVLMAGPAAACAQDLPAIRKAVDDYAAGLNTLEGSFKEQSRSDFNRSSRDLVMEETVYERQFAIDFKRNRMLVDERKRWIFRVASEIEPFRARTIRAFDGEAGAFMVYATQYPSRFPSPADAPHTLSLGGAPNLKHDVFPWDLAGLRLPEGHGTLSSLLRLRDARVEGRDQVGEADCLRISSATGSSRYTIWLDEEHDFLPRRIEYARSSGAEPPPLLRADQPNPDRQWLYRVDSFRELDDLAGGGKRWFPAHGVIESEHTVRQLEVVDVRMNADLPRERFQIDTGALPDGVHVRERGDPIQGTPGKEWHTGDRKDLFDEVEKLMESNHDEIMALHQESLPPPVVKPAPPVEPEADPIEPGGLALWRWILGGGAGLLLIVVIIAYALLRRRS